MDVEVRYFAGAREAAGRESESIPMPEGSTVDGLAAALVERHPALEAALPSLRFALDERFVPGDTALADGCVVALIPPVGGG